MPSRRHRAQRVQQRRLRRGHERRLERRRARRQQRLPHPHVPLVVGRHQVHAREPVDLQVDEARARRCPTARRRSSEPRRRSITPSAIDTSPGDEHAVDQRRAETPSLIPSPPRPCARSSGACARARTRARPAACRAPTSPSPRPSRCRRGRRSDCSTSGTVLRSSSLMNVSASRNSFQPSRKLSTAVDRQAGRGQRQHDPHHRADPRRAVDPRRVLELLRDRR